MMLKCFLVVALVATAIGCDDCNSCAVERGRREGRIEVYNRAQELGFGEWKMKGLDDWGKPEYTFYWKATK